MPINGTKSGRGPICFRPHQDDLAARPPADELALALEFARAEKSEASRRAYCSDFEIFRRWCEARNLSAMPATPATLAAFLACEAQRKWYGPRSAVSAGRSGAH
jgi:hypothetical protein